MDLKYTGPLKCRNFSINTHYHAEQSTAGWICRCLTKVLEKAMATHSSTLVWKIPWTEETGRLQSMGSLRVGYDWVTSLSLFTYMHWRRKWQSTPVFLLENPRDRGAWWAAVYGVAQSQTRLKRLSSSSSKIMKRSMYVAGDYHLWVLLHGDLAGVSLSS